MSRKCSGRLHTRIARFGNGNTYANVDDPVIPARFKGVIGNILGLDNMTRAVPLVHPPRLPKLGAPSASHSGKESQLHSSGYAAQAFVPGAGLAFGPQDMRIFYNETITAGTQDGSGGCIAIVGTSNVLDSALASFQNQFMTGESNFNVTRVSHGSAVVTGNDDETEAELDLEWSHAMAPGAALKLHVGKNLMDDIAGAVADTCDVVSISFSFCGPASGYAKTVDGFMKKGAALGKSIFVSAGDNGAAGTPKINCDPGTTRSVSEMAADPNVTAVGGTQFTPTYDQNHIVVGYSNNEQVWESSNAATGGGTSAVYAKPAYQSNAALTSLGVPKDGKRDIPDIALIAGFPGVFWGHDAQGEVGVTCCIGGTSLSAPIWAGFTRVLAQKLGASPGPMNPLIYQLALRQYGPEGADSGFHDITTGNNSVNGVTGFEAGPGYDRDTGWGTIDFDVFAAAAADPAPTPTPGPLTVPNAVSFGRHKVGTGITKTINLVNPKKNKTTAHLTADAALTNHTDFSIVSSTCTSGATVAAGKKCQVRVMFRPLSAGATALTDTLTFSDNASNGPQQVELTGFGK